MNFVRKWVRAYISYVNRHVCAGSAAGTAGAGFCRWAATFAFKVKVNTINVNNSDYNDDDDDQNDIELKGNDDITKLSEKCA
ncbi:hypothetical protein MRX96_028542 [Rhipicephalus microplus]